MGYQIGKSLFITLSYDAIRAGESLHLPFICLMCKKWSNAYEKVYSVNSDNNSLLEDLKCGEDCCGPLLGGVFDQHIGPLSHKMGNICFCCGRPACFFVEKNSSSGVKSIGICDDHIDILLDSVVYKKEEEYCDEKNKTRD